MKNKHLLSGLVRINAALVFLFLAMGVRVGTAQGQPDDQELRTQYSLYYEDFRNGNFKSALPYLQWILENAPDYPRNDDRNFERAVALYDSLAARAEDEATARQHLDSALVMFDRVVPTLKELGAEVNELNWLINKGRFIQKHPESLSDLQEQVPDIYRRAYRMAPSDIDSYYITFIISDYFRKGMKQETLDMMEEVEPRFQDNPEMMDYITQVRNSLFRTPAERMEFLEAQLEKKPDDIDLISELFEIYLQLGERDKAFDLSDRLLEMKPTAKAYQLIGKMRLDDGEPAEALRLYEEALKLPGADAMAREIYYNMGIAQQQLGRLANARTYFRKALDIDPNFGQAYIAIGDLYATAVSNCGSMEREDKAVYWLVADYYEKAKAVDPNVANAANSRLRSYTRLFPSEEEKFFKSWQAGQRYSINYGCYSWIGEATTVR